MSQLTPEGYQEILTALVESRIRDASEPARQKFARELAARGVEARDIRAAVQRAVDVDEKTPAEAARMVAAQLASAETWPAYADAARNALRGIDQKRASDHDHGKNLRVTPQEIRRKEFMACGLSEADAQLVEFGGYLHARVVGDDRVFGDVCKECLLDPWVAVQAAAWWADLFGGCRVSLRRALARQVMQRRCAESLLEHLDSITPRKLDKGEPLVPWHHPRDKTKPAVQPACIVRPLTDAEAECALEGIEEIKAKQAVATIERGEGGT